jgi:hypothetical protein
MCLVAPSARSRAEEWHDVQVLVREHAEHNTVVTTFTDTRKLSFACNWASHLTSIGVGGLIVQSGLKLSGSRGSSSAEEGSNMAWRCADTPAHAPTACGSLSGTARSRGSKSNHAHNDTALRSAFCRRFATFFPSLVVISKFTREKLGRTRFFCPSLFPTV